MIVAEVRTGICSPLSQIRAFSEEVGQWSLSFDHCSYSPTSTTRSRDSHERVPNNDAHIRVGQAGCSRFSLGIVSHCVTDVSGFDQHPALGTRSSLLNSPDLIHDRSRKWSPCCEGQGEGRLRQSKQPKPAEFISHSPVALAGSTLKFFPVCDRHMPTRVINKACRMQDACRQSYCGSWCTQHLAEKLVRQRHAIGLYPIMTGK